MSRIETALGSSAARMSPTPALQLAGAEGNAGETDRTGLGDRPDETGETAEVEGNERFSRPQRLADVVDGGRRRRDQIDEVRVFLRDFRARLVTGGGEPGDVRLQRLERFLVALARLGGERVVEHAELRGDFLVQILLFAHERRHRRIARAGAGAGCGERALHGLAADDIRELKRLDGGVGTADPRQHVHVGFGDVLDPLVAGRRLRAVVVGRIADRRDEDRRRQREFPSGLLQPVGAQQADRIEPARERGFDMLFAVAGGLALHQALGGRNARSEIVGVEIRSDLGGSDAERVLAQIVPALRLRLQIGEDAARLVPLALEIERIGEIADRDRVERRVGLDTERLQRLPDLTEYLRRVVVTALMHQHRAQAQAEACRHQIVAADELELVDESLSHIGFRLVGAPQRRPAERAIADHAVDPLDDLLPRRRIGRLRRDLDPLPHQVDGAGVGEVRLPILTPGLVDDRARALDLRAPSCPAQGKHDPIRLRLAVQVLRPAHDRLRAVEIAERDELAGHERVEAEQKALGAGHIHLAFAGAQLLHRLLRLARLEILDRDELPELAEQSRIADILCQADGLLRIGDRGLDLAERRARLCALVIGPCEFGLAGALRFCGRMRAQLLQPLVGRLVLRQQAFDVDGRARRRHEFPCARAVGGGNRRQ